MKKLFVCAVLTLTVLGLVCTSASAHGFRFKLFNRSQPCCQPVYVQPCCDPCANSVVVPGQPGVIVPGHPGGTDVTPPPPMETKYTSGAEIKRILYGPDLKPGEKPVNLSGLKPKDIILEVDGVKVTANKVLIDAREAAAKGGKKMALKVWDPAAKAAFTLALDLAAPNQLVMEFDVIPVDVTVTGFKSARP